MALVSGTVSALPPLNPLPHNAPVVMAEVDAYAQFLAGWPQQPINVVFSPPSDEQKLRSASRRTRSAEYSLAVRLHWRFGGSRKHRGEGGG